MRFSVFLLLFVLVALGAGAVFLMSWDIPAPTQSVERTIPNDRFDN